MIVKRHTMHCDVCAGVYVPTEGAEQSAMATRREARDAAGWKLTDLIDVCSDCLERRKNG